MARGIVGSAEDVHRARLARMTDEELLADVVVEAVKAGFDPELAWKDRAAAVRWYEGRRGDDGLKPA